MLRAPACHVALDGHLFTLTVDVVAFAADRAADDLDAGATVDIELVGAHEAHAATLGADGAEAVTLPAHMQLTGDRRAMTGGAGVERESSV